MTQINAHVEGEGLQLASLPRKRNLEKSVLSSSARRRVDRRGRQRVRKAHRSLVGRAKSPTWDLSAGKSPRTAARAQSPGLTLARRTP
jgi:hypothetical protein